MRKNRRFLNETATKEEELLQSVIMPTAFILAGGKGMRLRPLTENCPKPLLPVGGRAVIQTILEDLYVQGVRRAVLLTGYKGEQIETVLKDRFSDMELIFIKEERPLGSAGCLLAARAFAGERFFVVCADACGNRDYRGILNFHLEKGGIGSIFLAGVEDPVEYGLVRLGRDGRIERFLEKPVWSQTFTDLANTGIYLFEKEIFDFIPQGQASDFGKDIFPKILAAGRALYGYEDGGFWMDMGSLDAYLACNLWANGEKSVIGKNCAVDRSAEISLSVLMDGCSIGKNCVLNKAVVGRDVVIEEGCILEEGCVVGDHSHLEKGCCLKKGRVVETGTRIKSGVLNCDHVSSIAPFFEESDLVLQQCFDRDFYIRLGYAFAKGAKGRIAVMHDGKEETKALAEALCKGGCLVGDGAADLGKGFYTMASACALYGNFSLTALVTKEKTENLRIALFDMQGLPLNGGTVRKIRDAFQSPLLCGRVGKVLLKEGWARTLYTGLLLEGIPSLVGLTVGMDKGTPASDLTSELLQRTGARVVPFQQGRINLYVSPDGRRCALSDDTGRKADFWHMAAIVLSDRLRRGARLKALPDRAPEVLFHLAEKHCARPLSFSLCSAEAVGSEGKDTVLRWHFLFDGCMLACCCLALVAREGVTLAHLMGLLPSFALEESGIDCGEKEKVALLLKLGGVPSAEGVKVFENRGTIHAVARGGRGLWLMAEAAKEEDVGALLRTAREKLLRKKGESPEI